MALSWGKPKIEVAPFVDGALPASPVYTAFPEVREDSARLSTTKGKKREARAEGGDLVDMCYSKNSYTFECEVFVKSGDTRPIEDNDGVIATKYAVRLTPEDPSAEGFIFEKSLVSVEEIWSAADGKLLKYTFEALKPANGKMCKPYTGSAV